MYTLLQRVNSGSRRGSGRRRHDGGMDRQNSAGSGKCQGHGFNRSGVNCG